MVKRWWLSLVVLLFGALLIASAAIAQPLGPSGDSAMVAGVRSLAPLILVQPQSSTVPMGDVFTVEVQAGGVTDLGSFDFTLTFNPTTLSVLSTTLGSFLGSTGRTTGALGPVVDNVAGSVRFGAFSFGTAAGPSGSGTLATFTLRALSPGSSPLHLASAQYTDTQIPVSTQVPDATDGAVTVLSPTPTPTATPPVRHAYLPVILRLGP